MRSIAIVGGGFGGIGAAAMLRLAGFDEVRVYERSDRIGGVWDANTYPGSACDIPSHLYEFSFAPNWRWTRRYAPQPEIQSYLESVAVDHGVRDRIELRTEVQDARWDELRSRWVLRTSRGEREADVLITSCGQLSRPKPPAIAGLEEFAGPSFHTARWRPDLPLDGRRVAVIGTGASGAQVGPAIQPRVAQLDVYQRSPSWTFPRLDFGYPRPLRRLFRLLPWLVALERAGLYSFYELATAALTSRPRLRRGFQAFARMRIRRAISDPELRRQVTPSDEIGCKRILITDDWYPMLTRANVALITQPISSVTPTGIRLADGSERPTDAIVFATGFDSHAFVAPMSVQGVGGRSLAQEWGQIPRAYLGLTVPGFPNMFLLFGPNTNGGAGSVLSTIEAGVQHVIAALRALEHAGATTIEVRRDAAEQFDRELRGALPRTVWHTGCRNWYLDENGNDPNQWPWQARDYRRRTAELAPGAYELRAALSNV